MSIIHNNRYSKRLKTNSHGFPKNDGENGVVAKKVFLVAFLMNNHHFEQSLLIRCHKENPFSHKPFSSESGNLTFRSFTLRSVPVIFNWFSDTPTGTVRLSLRQEQLETVAQHPQIEIAKRS